MLTPRPETPDDAPREPDTGRTFSQKLRIFLTGIAIGLMFLGWTQARKNMAVRRQQAQQAAQPADAAPETQATPTDQSPG